MSSAGPLAACELSTPTRCCCSGSGTRPPRSVPRFSRFPGVGPWNQFFPLRTLGTIRGRRGEPGHAELLDRSEAYAAGTTSVPWVTQVRAARAELLWVSGEPDRACREAREACRAGARPDRSVAARVGCYLVVAPRGQLQPAGRLAGAVRAGDRRGLAGCRRSMGTNRPDLRRRPDPDLLLL